mgnify:CR=1 FL=1
MLKGDRRGLAVARASAKTPRVPVREFFFRVRRWLPAGVEFSSSNAAPVIGRQHSFLPYLGSNTLTRRICTGAGQGLDLAAADDDVADLDESLVPTTAAAPSADGEPTDGHRHIYWNFVASDRADIEDAKQRWENDAFANVPGETERIPLPSK